MLKCPHCPYKTVYRSNFERCILGSIRDHTANTSQLFNLKKSGAFWDHMTYLQEKVKLHIEQHIDPLTTPIPMPVTILQQPSVSQPSRDPLSTAVPAPLNPTPTHPRAVTPELRPLHPHLRLSLHLLSFTHLQSVCISIPCETYPRYYPQ